MKRYNMQNNCCSLCRQACCPKRCPRYFPPSPPPPPPPSPEPICQVTTGIATDITPFTALIEGNQFIVSLPVLNVGAEISTDPGFTTALIFYGSAGNPFSVELSGLIPATTYYYRAFAQTALGVCRGMAGTFTTPIIPPTPIVITGDAVNITVSSALIEANQFSGIPAPIFSVGVEYAVNPSLIGSITVPGGTIETPYNVQLNGLAPATTYYYRATISAESGTFVGEIKSFVTPANPSVNTGDADSITRNTATIISNTFSNIPGSIFTVGVQYATNPLMIGAITTNAGSVGTPYFVNLSSLLPNTTYYFRAVITASEGLFFGEVKSFTTLPNPVSAVR